MTMRASAALLWLPLFTGCSLKTLYPALGGLAGGAAGAAVGGIGGAALGAGLGTMGGQLAKGDEELQQAKDTVDALTKGDVKALLDVHAGTSMSGLDSFLSSLNVVLMVAAGVRVVYLAIPLFYASRCARKTEAKLTRGPFPAEPKTTGREK